MGAIYVLWLRELKRYFRSKAQLAASLGQPLLYLLALGYGLSPVFRRSGEGSYLEFIAPGVIAMTVLFSSLFSGIQLIWDRQFGFLKETLVAPVPRLQIMIGRTCGAATTSMIQGLLVAVVSVIAGFRPVGGPGIALGLLFLALIAIVFTAVGTTVGSTLKDMQGFQMIMNFLVLPIFFLSGALYPLTHLPAFLTALTTIDPLTYGVDGLRGALIGRMHFSVPIDLIVMAVLAMAVTALGAWRFSRIEV
ncbi:MAG: ABC transporter permease [Pseudomonadota bacterium]|jgi:ABC-2 type transport system permease protein|nr:ABC transporter permease [Pseudomonadota bacterium]